MFDLLGSIREFQVAYTKRLLKNTPLVEMKDAIYHHYAEKNGIKVVDGHDHLGSDVETIGAVHNTGQLQSCHNYSL